MSSNKNTRIDLQTVMEGTNRRKRTLGLFDLSIMGIGSIIGTGILVLTGIVSATEAGPAIIISFLIAALGSTLIGLCYSELTTSIPSSGSAYMYTWVAIGQKTAFFAGWSLIGAYMADAATVANGWTGYFQSFLGQFGVTLPHQLLKSAFEGGVINLPAVIMTIFMTLILTRGTSKSKWINNALVLIKISIIILFIVVAMQDVNPTNWHDFLPFGWQGVFLGSSTIFFSFLGFDVLATSSEEVKDVKHTLPKAIGISILVSTTLYIVVSLVMTGAMHYTKLNVPEAMSYVLLSKHHILTAQIVSGGAILGIMAVVYAYVYAASNIVMSMGRGGFLPTKLSHLNSHTHSPNRSIWLIGSIVCVLAGLLNVKVLAVITNIGCLLVFLLISLVVILLRKEYPKIERPFKLPFGYTIPILSILVCGFLLMNTSKSAWVIYLGWILIGAIIYILYSRFHIKKSKK